MYLCYFVPSESRSLVDIIKEDDVIGRQTIIVKDAQNFSFKEAGVILILEGTKEPLEKAESILGSKALRIDTKKSDEIYRKIKEEEEQADKGMGFLFG
ncbi:MAG: hypothetical protein M1306_02145 [Candidatus Thermoplasmatota archaeon]|jgi:hypothetical protein|nr:hypothetical protein [Candidatus Thermoplasmatota archaeon]